MNFNPIDIMIVIILITFMFFGFRNRFLSEIKKNISLVIGIILTNLIIENLSKQFYFLNQKTDIIYLSIFLIILILIILLVSFIFNILIEQMDDLNLDKYLDIVLGSSLGMIKGIITITLLIFIFDTTPIDKKSREKLYDKVQSKSILFKQCKDFKNLLFKN